MALLMNNIQHFQQVEPLLRTSPVAWDFLMPEPLGEQYKTMIDDARDYLAARNLKARCVTEVPTGHVYRIVLTPYIIEGPHPASTYRVRYLYGLAKEDYIFDTFNLYYDLILCFGPYDEEFLSAYTSTVQTGNLRYAFTAPRPRRTPEPPYKLLYLPTWRENCSLPYLRESLAALSGVFDISIRLHMASHYREPEIVEAAQGLGRILDVKVPLAEQLADADVVLSDSSGAICDAIAMDVPIVVFQPVPPDPFEGKPSIEQILIENDLVPCATTPAELPSVLLEAVKHDRHGESRRQLAAELLPLKGQSGLDAAWKALRTLLDGEPQLTGGALVRKRIWRRLTAAQGEAYRLRTLLESTLLDLASIGPEAEERLGKGRVTNVLNDTVRRLSEGLV